MELVETGPGCDNTGSSGSSVVEGLNSFGVDQFVVAAAAAAGVVAVVVAAADVVVAVAMVAIEAARRLCELEGD